MKQAVPEGHTYFDEPMNAACHIIKDPASNAVAIIDSILDVDAAAGRTHTRHADTRRFLCHDCKTKTRDTFCWQTTGAEQKAAYVHVGGGTSEVDIVDFRAARDAQLAMPKLIIPSIQVNRNAGKMPEPDSDGHTYLKVPINRL